MSERFIPQNPVKELDEIYAKDDKIYQIDLESIATAQMKEKEEKKFQEDIAALSNELATLDEGKYQSMLKSSPPISFFLLTPSENRSMTHTLLSFSLLLTSKA